MILAIIAFHSGILLPSAAVLIEIGSHRQGGVRVVFRNAAVGLLCNPIIVSIMLGFVWRATGLAIPFLIQQILILLGQSAARRWHCSAWARRCPRLAVKAR